MAGNSFAEEGEPALDVERIADRLRPLGSSTRLRLLRFLVRPHYLEEIASYLKMNRYAAKRHVDELESIGLVRSVPGRRDSGPVREYVVAPEAFFEVYDAVRALGEIRPAKDTLAETLPGVLTRTKPAAPTKKAGRPQTPYPFLVVVYGAEIGRAYPLAPKKEGLPLWSVGRDAKSDVLLDNDPFVSNRHARVAAKGTDLVLTDAFSTNGTWLNWDRLAEGEGVPLLPGDVVGIGRTLLVYRPGSL